MKKHKKNKQEKICEYDITKTGKVFEAIQEDLHSSKSERELTAKYTDYQGLLKWYFLEAMREVVLKKQ